MRGPRLRLLLVLLVLTAFTLTVLDVRGGGAFDALRRGADTVFGPAQRALGGVARSAGGALGDLPRLGEYRADNERLERENEDLRRRLVEQEGLEATREQLRELLQLKDAGTYTTVLARVVGYGAYQPFSDTLTLDVGERDGVRVDQTVTSGLGLVGRTVRVGPDTTTVALLTDPTFSVGARLNGSPRSFGVASGPGLGRPVVPARGAVRGQRAGRRRRARHGRLGHLRPGRAGRPGQRGRRAGERHGAHGDRRRPSSTSARSTCSRWSSRARARPRGCRSRPPATPR